MNTLKDILNDVFGVSLSDIKDSSTLEELGLDSISIIEYQIETERAFNLKQGSLSFTNQDNFTSIMEKIKGVKNE
ncbi:TPA: acyl carrier protein [Salmonella enterica subsp. salamae]|nr:acyl carrier protein [Salmonella enterica subsp. enterica serovar Virchow]ECH9260210.1 acyl carrier protein [Salmonella enterica subsp. enterica]EDW9585750.1 acyl carrier protein [Salmonella enterica subsp. enterica]EED9672599.1 acyl carrier protein [Salmonella enterica subsp. enterica]HAU3359698.1 acyl carrier protein [Salmonella enterica subsp. salamae]